MKNGIFPIALMFAITAAVWAQTPVTRNPRNPDPNRQDAATQRWYEELQRRENVPTGVAPGPLSQATVVVKLRTDALRELAPTDDEKLPFVEFLKRKGTGLIRLAAPVDCARILDVTNPDVKCNNRFVPGSALAYDFRGARYVHPAYSDIERRDGNFTLPGTYIMGIIVDLGNVPIENLTTDSPEIAALLKFRPAEEIEQIIRQDRENAKGISVGELTARKSAPIIDGSTYILRSIAYRAKFLNLPKEAPRKSLDEDERFDITVVFRVVKVGPDDSLLLLWKELARRASPRIAVDMSK